ncbi:methyl-accepting chemotaxis protein [Solidesulfovibrio sp.]|uniref:methyl-accepting chemotaxis protein n=1 Tax=Solidesulfovibrio sp. TaxID=2910990 RepID=UPI002B20E805|nr:nitrate- and nitrite sensing domain-containing protein [Solidesulfovibrio sp.]MEA5089709.1 methyl-accepting chemotaxis protein [Solidesulfovibrio sp.]
MLANMNMSGKLSLLLALPMAAFLFYAATESYGRWQALNRLNQTELLLRVTQTMGELVHELQKERGLSSGYASSRGARFGQELEQQKKRSDAARERLEPVIQAVARQKDAPFQPIFSPVLSRLQELNAAREAVSGLRFDALEVIASYNACIASMLDAVSQGMALASGTGMSLSCASILQLMRGKEIAGQERASLSGAFAAGTFGKQLYRDWLIRVSAQDTYLRSFADMGGKEARTLLEEKLRNADAEVERFRELAYANSDKPHLDVDPAAWFAAATRRIDLMMQVEKAWDAATGGQVAALLQSARSSLFWMASSAVLVALVTATLGWRICLAVGRPLRRTLDFAEKISRGELNAALDVNQKDEIGGLAVALRGMVLRLKEQIDKAREQFALAQERGKAAEVCRLSAETAGREAESRAESLAHAADRIRSVAENVAAALAQLSEQVDLSGRGAEGQARRIGETVTAMAQMNATVLEVAANAASAVRTAEQARSRATDGARAVGEVVSGIAQVQRQSQAMKGDMDTLGSQAQSIGQILDVISDIADQTNLLALNAAIEAARAGEAGRGFAVVADEVRKLAEKTMTATKEVGEAIRGIQAGTRKNVDHVERAGETIEAVTGLAGHSGASLREIVSLAEATTDQVRSIATASEQQSAASETIHHSLADINRIATETSEAMARSEKILGELTDQAGILETLLADMRQGGGASALPAAMAA